MKLGVILVASNKVFQIVKPYSGKDMHNRFIAELERTLPKEAMQMENQVISNIQANGNIDTGTLVSNLERGVEEKTAWVMSDTDPNPTHSGYAPALEDGTWKTPAYPNFEPALEMQATIAVEHISDFKF